MGLFRVVEAFWVNHPDAIRVAESKPWQLKVAQQLFLSLRQLFAKLLHRWDGLFINGNGNSQICLSACQNLTTVATMD